MPSHELPAKPEPVALDAKLEALDDVMFPAIDGDAAALAVAPTAWSATVADVGRPAVEETRRQYLRYASDVWRRLQNAATSEPLRILAVLKIIAILIGDDV